MENKEVLKKYGLLLALVVFIFMVLPLISLVIFLGITVNLNHLYGLIDLATTWLLLR